MFDLYKFIEKCKAEKGNSYIRSLSKIKLKEYRIAVEVETDFLPKDCNFSQRLFHILKCVDSVPICECGKNLRFQNIWVGYTKFCSAKCRVKCAMKSISKDDRKASIEKMKSTNLMRYGVEYAPQAEEVKAKSIVTCIEKYGTEHHWKNHNIREKCKVTLRANYGVDFPCQSTEIKNKMKSTNLMRYGVEYAPQAEEVKTKSIATCIEKYGTEYPLQSEDVKRKMQETMVRKYGESFSMQIPTFFEKAHRPRNFEYVASDGRTYVLQGYEHYAIEKLLYERTIFIHGKELNRRFKFIYMIDDKRKRYFPDFFLEKENKIVEVKSEYTFKRSLTINLLKRDTVLSQGFNFEFWIFDASGNLRCT